MPCSPDLKLSAANRRIEPGVAIPPGIRQSTFSIGGVSFKLSTESLEELHLTNELRQFQRPAYAPDIEVDIAWTETLPTHNASKRFDSMATWKLFQEDRQFLFEFVTPLLGPQPYKQMRVDELFTRAEISLSRVALADHDEVSALEYPVCELLITNYLAHHRLGVEVHGCGLIDDETGGHLFLGHSGAGKSTTARLWETFREAEILSDDRIILRLHDGELWMYGTPWHGEAAFASPRKARLSRIHILRHGTTNKFAALPAAKAVSEIFARSFPPFHSPQALQHTIDFLKKTMYAVPCYEFEFIPDQSAVAAVLQQSGCHD
jgi:hypothetical protein